MHKPIQPETLLDLLYRLTNFERRGKILLIDDEEAARYVLRQFLSEDAYVISEARTGREGLSLARSEKPDLIFLDLKMADLDGYSVLSELKQDQETRAIPVVIHTSDPMFEARRSQLAAAFDILPKSALGEPGADAVMGALLTRVGIGRTAIATIAKGEHA